MIGVVAILVAVTFVDLIMVVVSVGGNCCKGCCDNWCFIVGVNMIMFAVIGFADAVVGDIMVVIEVFVSVEIVVSVIVVILLVIAVVMMMVVEMVVTVIVSVVVIVVIVIVFLLLL